MWKVGKLIAAMLTERNIFHNHAMATRTLRKKFLYAWINFEIFNINLKECFSKSHFDFLDVQHIHDIFHDIKVCSSKLNGKKKVRWYASYI